MKYIASSDWHIRSSNPQYRIDDYSMTILGKVQWIIKLANKLDAQILVAGDVFHNVKAGTPIINRLIKVLRKARHIILAVLGQHDLQNHNIEDLIPTPFLTLIEAGVIELLDENGYDDRVYGISWNSDLSEDIVIPKEAIVVMHQCVTPGEPAFFLEEDGMSAEDAMEMLPEFKYIITGDYHVPHITKKGDQVLINCGCIGRSNKDQHNHKPRVYLIDTESDKIRKYYIPIQDYDSVFKVPGNSKRLDEEFANYVEEIAKSVNDKENRPEFIVSVMRILNDGKFTKRQKEIAQKYYNEVRNE